MKRRKKNVDEQEALEMMIESLAQIKSMRSFMTPERAIKLAGSRRHLGLILGAVQAVYQWTDTIPDGRLWQLRCLRPDWF